MILGVLPDWPRGLCLECVASESDRHIDQVEAVIGTLTLNMWVTVITQGNCARCLRDRDLLCIDRWRPSGRVKPGA